MAQLTRRLAVGVVVAATVSACGTGVPKRTADVTPPPEYAAAAAKSDWAQFFAQPNTSCVRRSMTVVSHATSSASTRALGSAVHAISDPSVSGRSPSTTLTDVWSTGAAWNTFEGLSFVVADRETVTHASRRTSASTDTTRTLYTITRSGALKVPAQSQVSGKYTFANENALVYPTVAELRAGTVVPTEVRFDVTASNDPSIGSFANLTLDGSSAIRLAMTYEFRLVTSPASIVTPSGTYRDLLGVQTRVRGARVLNLPAALTRRMLTSFGKRNEVTTDWFARGVGLVREVDDRGTTDLVGCAPWTEPAS